MAGPLSGVRIIDLTRLYPGPFGTQLLGDLGAEVIKVEDKNSPDYIRFFPPTFNKEGAGYIAVNRNKKSLALDLRSDRGKEIFFRLVEKSDVVVEQYRPGVLAKMGLGYEKAKKVNPRVIYCSITGFGQTGPYADLPGHDLNYMGLAGITDIIGPKNGAPVVPGIQVADVAGWRADVGHRRTFGPRRAHEHRQGPGRRRLDVRRDPPVYGDDLCQLQGGGRAA